MKPIQDAKAWLEGVQPGLSWLVLALIAGGLVWGFRQFDARVFVARGKPSLFDRIPPAFQFLPATLITGTLAAMASGADGRKVFVDAIVAAVISGITAVGGHHVFKNLATGGGAAKPPKSDDVPPTPNPPIDPSMMQRTSLLLAVVLVFSGCGGGTHDVNAPTSEPPPRAMARGAVLTIARVTTAADGACATAVRMIGAVDKPRAEKVGNDCLAALRLTAGALVEAERVLDAWGFASEAKYGCAMRYVVESLVKLQEAVAAGTSVPPIIDDALALARAGTAFAPEKCEVPR